MRKNLHLLLAATAVFTSVSIKQLHAQNTSPYWSLVGNSNASNTTSKLGTTNAINLRLFTNNVERMRILSTNGYVGVGTTAPASRFTINTASGTSALRAQVNGSTKLLVSSNGGLSVGSSTGAPANGLYVAGNVGIGTATPSYKLQVDGNASVSSGLYVGNNGVYGYNSGGPGVYASGSSYGVHAISYDGPGVFATSTNNSGVSSSSTYGYGVYSTGILGVYGVGNNTTNAYGVFGYGNHSDNTGSYRAIGVYGTAYNSGGVYGTTFGIFGDNYSGEAVHGVSYNSLGGNFISTNGYGLRASTTNGTYAAVFYGKVYASTGYTTSDRNLKQNIQEFSGAMDIISKLKPRHYEFRQDAKYAFLNLPKGSHYGLLAQDVEEVLPGLVSYGDHQDLQVGNTSQELKPDANGRITPPSSQNESVQKPETIAIKAVNYTELISIMVKGMQEQQRKIDELQSLVNQLLQQKGTNLVTSIGSLEQNTPNPVSGTTSIRYHIPEESTSARLTFTNAKGQVVKTVTLSNRGTGRFTLNTQALPAGTYYYTLYVDGKHVDNKRLVVVR